MLGKLDHIKILVKVIAIYGLFVFAVIVHKPNTVQPILRTVIANTEYSAFVAVPLLRENGQAAQPTTAVSALVYGHPSIFPRSTDGKCNKSKSNRRT